jgi:hypothetical protein
LNLFILLMCCGIEWQNCDVDCGKRS